MNETAISKTIRDGLERLGYWVERVNSGKVNVRGGWVYLASNGTPDTLVLAPVYGWLETKTDKGKLSQDQISWHERARKMGVRVATVRSISEAVGVVRGWMQSGRAA